MKKIIISDINTLENGKSIRINLSNIQNNIKIVDAVLESEIATSNLNIGEFQVNYTGQNVSNEKIEGWENVENLKISAQGKYQIDISDEVQSALDKQCAYFRLDFISDENTTLSFAQNKLKINYISLSEYRENGSFHSVEVGKAGKISVDLTTGQLDMSTQLVSTDSNVLPLSILANHSIKKSDKMPNIGLPNNLSLNTNQFLIKDESDRSLSFTYLDESGKEQLIEEKYFIEDGEKQYVERNDLTVNLDGTLSYNGKDVKTELIAPSGLKLVSSIEGIKGFELVDYEPEELANVKQQIKVLNTNIEDIETNLNQSKKQLCVLALTKEMLAKQLKSQEENILDTEKQIELQGKVEKIRKEAVIRNRYYRLNANDTNDGSRDNSIAKSALGTGAITYQKIKDLSVENFSTDSNIVQGNIVANESSIIYTFGYPDDGIIGTLASQKNNNNLSKELYCNTISKEEFARYVSSLLIEEDKFDIDYDNLWEEFRYQLNAEEGKKLTIGFKDLISVDLQIESLKQTLKTYSERQKEYQDNLKKYEYQQKQLETQVPVHYLYNDNNIIYGFGKTYDENDNETNVYRLIFISDAYENTIFISYESMTSNKISTIIDASEKAIEFGYENGVLKTITDARDRKIELDFKDDLHTISHLDGTKSFIYLSGNEISAVVNENGLGAKISYADGKVNQIDSISALDRVENGVIVLKNGVKLDEITDFEPLKVEKQKVSFGYNNYKSTSITNEKGKMITYLFDKFGKVRSVYENSFVETDEEINTLATEFNYQDKKKSEKISKLQYSTNLLKDLAFKASSKTIMSGLYLGDCFCSENTIPYSFEVMTQIHKIEAESSEKQDKVTLTNFDFFAEVCKHKSFILSGWAKADSAFVLTDEDEKDFPQYIKDRKFELRAEVKYSGEEQPVVFKKSFDWRNTQWQYCAVPVVFDTNKQLEKVDCFVDFSNNTGSIIFSVLELKEGEFEKVEYDDNERPIKKLSGHSDFVEEYFYKDDASQPSKLTKTNTSTGETFSTIFEYNKQGNLLRTVDHNGIVKENVYNEKGQVVKTMTYHKDEPSSKLYEEKVLDEKGNETKTVNELGEETSTFEYVEGTGITSSQTDKNGVKTSYGYAKDDALLETSVTVDGIENTNTFGYALDFLTSLKHNNFEIGYDYDSQGRTSKVSIAGKEYLSKTYADKEDNTILASGEKYRQTFNDDGNVLETYYTPTSEDGEEKQEILISQNIYNSYGDLIDFKDVVNDEEHKIAIDKFGNTEKEETVQHGETFMIENQYDDRHSNVDCSVISIGAQDLTYCYERDNSPEARLKAITLPNNVEQTIEYDKLQRISSLTTGKISKKISYLKSGDHATNFVSKTQFAVDGINEENLRYCYDEKGNITEIRSNNELLTRYKYDGLSRIIREDNRFLSKTTTFTYDEGGNITCRKEYAFTLIDNLDFEIGISYDYFYNATGWRDQLREYNGQKFEYDALGNPTTYRDKTLVWSHGRQLDKFADISEYKYNVNGVRTSKVTHGFTTKFYLNGTKIIAQKDAANSMFFHYGADGLTGFSLNGVEYLYKKNIQNDIIGIYSTEGTQIAKYEYDAWGNQIVKYCKDGKFVDIEENFQYNDTSITNRFIAFKNPFRYRSYYYDFETNLYYLNSRYYDPQLGRFINADDVSVLSESSSFINGLNLYSYCSNNPIANIDETGAKWWDWLISILIAVVVIVAVVAVTVLTAGIGTAVAGALGGGIAATIFGSAVGGAITGAITGAIMGFGISVISQGMTVGYDKINWGQVGIDTLIGAGSGLVSGAVFGAIGGTTKVLNAAKMWDKGTFKSGLKSMKYHYTKHVVAEGFQKGKNILLYTKDAIQFATRNSNSLQLQIPFNGLQLNWTWIGKVGMNGQFTSLGKILTFWYL